MPQRNITITPRQEEFVEAALKSGRYGNVSEVFRAGLRLLEREEQEMLIREEMFQRELDKGREAFERGDYIKFTSLDEMHEWFQNRREQLKKEWSEEESE